MSGSARCDRKSTNRSIGVAYTSPTVSIPYVGNQPRAVAKSNSKPMPRRKYGVEYRMSARPFPM